MLRVLRNSFVTGLLTLLPLAITAYVLSFLMDHVGEPVSRILFGELQLSTFASLVADCIAIVLAVVLVAAVGAVSRYVIGRWCIGLTERVIGRLPFISMVYNTSKQIIGTFADGKRAVFQRAVLVNISDSHIGVIGFLSSEEPVSGELAGGGEAIVSVFVPTTPNPTSGFLVFVPKSRCTELKLSIGDAMKTIISGGVFMADSAAQEEEKAK
jgi:uncharacterized membrane protein